MQRRHFHRHLTNTLFAWNDNLWLLVATFLIAMSILLVQLEASRTETKTKDDNAAGSISVYVFWKDGIDLDLDIHLRNAEDQHIYYANLSGKVWNLLRDDLGMIGDRDVRNFENAYSRGIIPGEYIVNVHAYRGTKEMFPIEVEAEIIVAADSKGGKGSQKTFTQKVTLYKVKEEATLIRFTIDANKRLVDGSVSHEFISILKQG